jgi:rare lipoprotein A
MKKQRNSNDFLLLTPLINSFCMKQFTTIALAMIILMAANAQNEKIVSHNHRPRAIIGIASFYSTNLHHTKTSTGETYAHENLTGASNHFKLHTWVKVINMRNGKSVIVRINDHMNKKQALKGRVIDVSRSAALKLGFLSHGLTRVKLEEIIR